MALSKAAALRSALAVAGTELDHLSMPMSSVISSLARSIAPEYYALSEVSLMAEQQTFVFADLAGFTALTEAHGDRHATEIAQRYAAQVESLLPPQGADLVKTIGDEVMIRCSDCLDAVNLGIRIVDGLAEHRAPPVRVGMHTGPAIEAQGDWFGSTVNLASRVAGAARAGEVLLTEQTANALPDDCGVDVQPRGRRYFKHIPDSVPVYRAVGDGAATDLAIDPVCRMAVDPARAAAMKKRAGIEYYLCSEHCAAKFAASPRRFVARSPAARAVRAGFLGHLRVFAAVQLIFLAIWAVDLIGGGPATPWFLLVLIPWSLGVALHYRAVRQAL